MTHRELMIAWLDGPDPDRRAHARNVLATLDGTATVNVHDLGPLVARVRRCPHWSPGASCCDGWFCTLDPDEPRRVTIAGDCAVCELLPAEIAT